MRTPFVLIPDNVSTDTVECLSTLLEEAKKGRLIGIAYAAMMNRRGYIADSAGECFRNPTFARGMVAAIDDHLSLRIRDKP